MNSIGFQDATVERIITYYNEDNNHRYLLADEVGLGKTVVGRRVFEKMIQEDCTTAKVSCCYYVCGSLALAEENLKKLRPNVLKYSADYRNLSVFSMRKLKKDHAEVLLESCDRLSMGFLRDLYNTKLRRLFMIDKVFALYLVINEKQDLQLNLKKYGAPKAIAMRNWDDFQKNLFGNIEEIEALVLTCFLNSQDDKLVAFGRNNEVILKMVGLLNACGIIDDIKTKTKTIIDSIKTKLSQTKGLNPNIWSEAAELEKIYDQVVGIRNISLVSLTPKTSVFYTTHGKREEKRLVWYVIKNIWGDGIEDSAPLLWKTIENVKGSKESKEDKKWDEFINKIVSDEHLKEIGELAKTIEYEEHKLKADSHDVLYEKIKTIKTEKEENEKIYIADIFSDDVLNEVEKLNGEQKSLDKICKNIYIAMRKLLSIYTVQGNSEARNLVIVDEFQNYSEILNSKEQSANGIVARELLQNSAKNYVLLLSATPFKYSTKIAKADIDEEDSASELSSVQENESISGNEMIDDEVESILKYVMEEDYEKWCAINCKRNEVIKNGQSEDADWLKEIAKLTRDQENCLFSNGISRVERKNVGIDEHMMLTLDTKDDKVLLKKDLLSYPRLYLGNKEIDQWQNGDYLTVFCVEGQIDHCIVRKDKNSYIYGYCNKNLLQDVESYLYTFEEDTELEIVVYKVVFVEQGETEIESETTEFTDVPWIKFWSIDEVNDENSKRDMQSVKILITKKLQQLKVPVSYMKDTPFVFSFAEDYKSLQTTTIDKRYHISKEAIEANQELNSDHARYNRLKEDLLSDDNTKLLFIPPSMPYYPLTGVFEKYDNSKDNEERRFFSKSLIFSKYNHTPRALAALLSYEAQRPFADSENKKMYYNLEGEPSEYMQENVLTGKVKEIIEQYISYNINTSEKGDNDYRACLQKEEKQIEDYICLGNIAGYFTDFCFSMQKEKNVSELKELVWNRYSESICALYRIFLTRDAGDILSKLYSGEEYKDMTYLDKIHLYCGQGCIRAVLDEYIFVMMEKERINDEKDELAKELGKNLRIAASYQTGTIKTKEGFAMNTGYAIGHYKGAGENTSDAKTLSNKLLAFNSPFRPFVFISTSVGQEGFDFHWYCKNIVHWSVIYDPVKFEQREGRINRYHGHQVRQNVAVYAIDKKVNCIKDSGKFYKIWNEMLESAESSPDGMSPDWVYPPKNYGKSTGKYSSLTRRAYFYPCSKEADGYEKLKEYLANYRALLGQAQLEDYEDQLFDAIKKLEEDKREGVLESLFVDINPYRKKST